MLRFHYRAADTASCVAVGLGGEELVAKTVGAVSYLQYSLLGNCKTKNVKYGRVYYVPWLDNTLRGPQICNITKKTIVGVDPIIPFKNKWRKAWCNSSRTKEGAQGGCYALLAVPFFLELAFRLRSRHSRTRDKSSLEELILDPLNDEP